jgi:hypothetical protein
MTVPVLQSRVPAHVNTVLQNSLQSSCQNVCFCNILQMTNFMWCLFVHKNYYSNILLLFFNECVCET